MARPNEILKEVSAGSFGGVKDSIVIDGTDQLIKLSGDQDTPGNNKVYGTNGSGSRIWRADSDVNAVETAARIAADAALQGNITAEAAARAAADTTLQTNITAEASARTTADNLRVLKAGDTMSGNLAMGGSKVTGLATATTNGDAVRYEQLAAKADVIQPAWADITLINSWAHATNNRAQYRINNFGLAEFRGRIVSTIATDPAFVDNVTNHLPIPLESGPGSVYRVVYRTDGVLSAVLINNNGGASMDAGYTTGKTYEISSLYYPTV